MITVIKTDGGKIAAGFTNETRDCSVRAVALAADVPYADAHLALKKAGRRDRKGASMNQIKHALSDVSRSIATEPIAIVDKFYATVTYPTLQQVIRSHRTGRYVICTGRHAMALIDGQIHDAGEISGPRSRIMDVVKVEPRKSKEVAVEQIISQDQINELWARLDKLEARTR